MHAAPASFATKGAAKKRRNKHCKISHQMHLDNTSIEKNSSTTKKIHKATNHTISKSKTTIESHENNAHSEVLQQSGKH